MDWSFSAEEDATCITESPYQDWGDFSLLEGYFGGGAFGPSAPSKKMNGVLLQEVNTPPADKETPQGPSGKGKAGTAKGPALAPPKGKGKGAPAAKAKGEGKKAGKSRPAGDGKGAEAKAVSAAPFGRRMHWVHPRYQDPDHDTIFGDLGPVGGVDFDTLASLLRGGDGATKTKKTPLKKNEGIKVLDASRAQNMAIVLSKLPISSQELCDALLHLDFSAMAVSEDMVELLTGVLPTNEECDKLKMYQDSPEELRDIEQKVLPFCFLPRSHARLRLLRLASSHSELCAQLRTRCENLRCAAQEAMTSSELRQLFAVILRIGNYINHGSKNGDDGAARGFSIETLPAITSFKLGNMSTLQFLCVTFRRSQPNFFDTLLSTLPHVTVAAREKSANLKSSIQQFRQELEFAERELHQLEKQEGELSAKESMRVLVSQLQREVDELTEAVDTAFERCVELQKYFCTEDSSSSTPVFENFFQCLHDFLETLRKAWRETEPAKPRSSGVPGRPGPAGKAKVVARRRAGTGPRRSSASAASATPQKEEAMSRSAADEKDRSTEPAELWEHLDADVESLLDHIFQSSSPSKLPESEGPMGPAAKPRGDSFDVDELIDTIFAD